MPATHPPGVAARPALRSRGEAAPQPILARGFRAAAAGEDYRGAMKLAWSRTENGWALNLDGTDAARVFSLPCIELRAGPDGWTCCFHLGNGMSRFVPLRRVATAAEAMQLATESGLAAFGTEFAPALRALLGPSSAPADGADAETTTDER